MKPAHFRILAATAAVGVLSARAGDPPAEAAPEEQGRQALARVERGLSGITNVQARFTETRELAVFQDKVILRGRFLLQDPDRFAWHVEEPIRYALVLADACVRQWDEETGRVQRIPLSANPVFSVVVEQMRGWFSGRYAALVKDYNVRQAAEQPFTIEFTPRPGSMAAKAVARVLVVFRDDERYVQEIRIEEKGGDRTTMAFSDALVNTPIPPEAWEVKPLAR